MFKHTLAGNFPIKFSTTMTSLLFTACDSELDCATCATAHSQCSTCPPGKYLMNRSCVPSCGIGIGYNQNEGTGRCECKYSVSLWLIYCK